MGDNIRIRKTKENLYSFSYDGQKYSAKVLTINQGRFFIIRGIGHIGLDEAYFVADTDCAVCSPEYTRRHDLLQKLHPVARAAFPKVSR